MCDTTTTKTINRSNGNAHFVPVRSPNVPGIGSSCDMPLRDNSDEKPCALFSGRKVQPTTKPADAQVEEENRAWPFGPAPIAATEDCTRPWPFTPCAEPTISFVGPVAREMSNLCHMFGIADNEEPVEKALMAS